MFQRGSGNDAIVGFADGNALLAQFAINVSCPDEYSFGHWQHNQWIQIAPGAPVGGVIGFAGKSATPGSPLDTTHNPTHWPIG